MNKNYSLSFKHCLTV